MNARSLYVARHVRYTVLVLSLAACSKADEAAIPADTAAPATTMTPPPPSADDAEDRVERALEADTALQVFGLDADDHDGRVVLKGKVRTSEQQALAAQIAGREGGGVPVDNRITIDARAGGGARPVDVDDLEDQVEDAIEADSTLKGFDIDVDEDNGGLALEGKVKTAAQQTLANDIAKRIAATVTVVNRIRVE